MANTQIEAMRLALEALESSNWYIDQLEMIVYSADDNGTHEERTKVQQAITSLRQAIADLESQEPVAWADMGTRDVDNDAGLSWTHGHFHTTPLYTHPPQRTEQEPVEHQKWCASLTQLLLSMPPQPAPCNCQPPKRTWVGLTDEEINEWTPEIHGVIQAIEAKLKELNT